MVLGIHRRSKSSRKCVLTVVLSLSLVPFLSAVINACNAGLHSDKLYAMATRTRRQYLTDLCKEYASSASLDQVGGGGLGQWKVTPLEATAHNEC